MGTQPEHKPESWNSLGWKDFKTHPMGQLPLAQAAPSPIQLGHCQEWGRGTCTQVRVGLCSHVTSDGTRAICLKLQQDIGKIPSQEGIHRKDCPSLGQLAGALANPHRGEVRKPCCPWGQRSAGTAPGLPGPSPAGAGPGRGGGAQRGRCRSCACSRCGAGPVPERSGACPGAKRCQSRSGSSPGSVPVPFPAALAVPAGDGRRALGAALGAAGPAPAPRVLLR